MGLPSARMYLVGSHVGAHVWEEWARQQVPRPASQEKGQGAKVRGFLHRGQDLGEPKVTGGLQSEVGGTGLSGGQPVRPAERHG